MQKKIVSLAAPILIGIMTLALGWFAHAAVPLSAQGVVVEGLMTLAQNPAAPAALGGARLTYQGRLTNSSGAPINSAVIVTCTLYNSGGTPVWTSSPTRTVTPTNGLFTVYLGDGADLALTSPVLVQSASIGVAVGSDPEMTPRQALNTVIGHSDTDAGVYGTSSSATGVYGWSTSGNGVFGRSFSNAGEYGLSYDGNGVEGHSNNGFGVYGESNYTSGVRGFSTFADGVVGSSNTGAGVIGSSSTGDGVLGSTSNISSAGIVAFNTVTAGPALQIIKGGIKVVGAGVGSLTPVFIQQVVTGGGGNICTGHPHATVVDNPLTNGNASAILIVTLNYRKSDASQSNGLGPAKDIPAVFYSVSGFCGVPNDNRWVIYNVNGTAMVDNTYYNVLVVIP